MHSIISRIGYAILAGLLTVGVGVLVLVLDEMRTAPAIAGEMTKQIALWFILGFAILSVLVLAVRLAGRALGFYQGALVGPDGIIAFGLMFIVSGVGVLITNAPPGRWIGPIWLVMGIWIAATVGRASAVARARLPNTRLQLAGANVR